MRVHPRHLIGAAWGAFVLVWLLAAPWTRRTVESEPTSARLQHTLPLALSAMLLFGRSLDQDVPVLGMRLFPLSAAVAWAGAWVTVVGVAWAIWARFTLGRLWSANITLKEEHRIVQRGPTHHAPSDLLRRTARSDGDGGRVWKTSERRGYRARLHRDRNQASA